jgi:endonuclease/exonuclease/phosphatase (EEP) superfamily protein YafD
VVTKTRRTVRTAGGTAALVLGGCGLVSRYLPVTGHTVLALVAFSSYLLLFAAVSIPLLILARRWTLSAVAVALTVAMLVIQVPMYVGSSPSPADGVSVRVVSANLRDGQADPLQLVRAARDDADVLAVQELTPPEVDRLSAAGLDAAFPYRFLDARSGAQGVGLWSRFPLDAARRIGGYTFALVTADLRVPGVAANPTVVVAHLPGPWPPPIDDWRRDIAHLPGTLHDAANQAGSGCVLVAADFNGTMDMRPFRTVLNVGYRDAAEQSGSGILPTYPGNSPIPPLLAIDHILTRNCVATSLRTLKIPGSDHRGIVATVLIPHSPAVP